MTIQQAIEHAKQGVAHRAKEEQIRREREAAAISAAALAETAAKRAFVDSWLPKMVERLDAEIKHQARNGKPSASCNLGWASAYLQDMPEDHLMTLLEALRKHYGATGFTVYLTKPTEYDWGSIQVSGWMESPCG